MQADKLISDRIQGRQFKCYGHSLKRKIVVDKRRFSSGHRTVGGEEEDGTIMEEPSDGLHEKQKPGRRYGRG